MPLHLLGKKSWNVYNADNVERVRRDEADAKAREEAADQLMQEQDAERRMALLRGEKPPAVVVASPAVTTDESRDEHTRGPRQSEGRERKRRRLKGEDDTEREMRYAREDAEAAAGSCARESFKQQQQQVKPSNGAARDDAPLQDRRGHIQLVAAPEERRGRGSEPSHEDKTAQREKRDAEQQQQQGMRFGDAAGYRKGMDKPWYTASTSNKTRDRHDGGHHKSTTSELALAEMQGKDVWGNEDPRRVERERQRVTSSDPFAMMQQAQKQLKRSESDREQWKAERDREMLQLRRDEDRKRRHERKHDARRGRRWEEQGDDGLEGFSLDEPAARESRSRPGDRGGSDRGGSDRDGNRRHRQSRRHRSRERSSRSRSRERRRR